MQDYSAIREEVAKLCAAFPGPYWQAKDKARAYPSEFVAALGEAGYLAALIPEEYGGAGLPLSAAAAILEEIQRQGCNGGAVHAQMYVMGTVLRHGSEEQKARYLPRVATGELRLQAFGVTEPTSGTDTLSLKTVARKDGDHYVVNGQKLWTSRAEHSDLMILLARTTQREEAASRTEGLSVFLVDMKEALAAGSLTIRPIDTMMNHATTEVFFDNMRIPAANLIGEEGKGFRYILSGMNAERLLIAAECIGDAKWFIDKASSYAKERVLFGRPIGRTRACNSRSRAPMPRCAPPSCSCATALPDMRRGRTPGRRPIWPRCSPPRRAGPPARRASRRTAASALPPNMTSSANSAKRASIRSRRSARI